MNDVLMSAIIQLSFVLILSWVFYFMFYRKDTNFFNWIGLYLPKNRSWIKSSLLVLVVSLLIMVGPLVLFQHLGYITSEMLYDETISGQGLSVNIVIIILLKALIQTSLSEEILFRGLIGKRIANKFGYLVGNIIQALLFGLPHGLPFIIVYKKYIVGITLIVMAGMVGYIQFWLNEKRADGSLVPSILLHGIMNVMSFTSKAIR